MYRYGSFGSSSGAVAGLGVAAVVLAIVATVLICIFIMPKKRAGQLSGFLAKLHDIVNFKTLIIEKILKVLYVFATCSVILVGFLEIFAGMPFFLCLAIIVIGPFLVRLMYEGLMLIIIGVQNIMEINHKLGGTPQPAAPAAPQPTAPAAPRQPMPVAQPVPVAQPTPAAQPVRPEPRMLFCTQCGTRYDAAQGPCPNCGHVHEQ